METSKINSISEPQKNRHVLIIEESSLKRTLILDAPTYSIGRHSSNDLILSSQKASRHHATLLRRTDVRSNNFSYWILDGDLQGSRSRNGIFINGKKCLVHELKHGDIIKFGAEATAKYQIVFDTVENLDNIRLSSTKEQLRNQVDVDSKKTIFNKETVINPYQQNNEPDDYELIRLASFAELSPHPVIEIDLQGNITYLNSAAIINFKNLKQKRTEHPLLVGLIDRCNETSSSLFIRQVEVDGKVFEQNAHYLPENKLIRSYLTDITEQKKVAKKLHLEQEIYHTLVEQISLGILIVNKSTQKIVHVNSFSCQLLGYELEVFKRLNIADLSWDKNTFKSILQNISTAKPNFVGEVSLRHQNGYTVPVEIKISLVGSASEEQFLIIIREIKEDNLSNLQEQVSSLPNQIFFQQQLGTAIANGKREQKLIAVMYLNLDRYTEIKKTLGDELTNKLIYSFADRLKACIRAGDTIAYCGGDRFAVLMPQIRTIEEVAKVGQRILDSLTESFKVGNNQLQLKSNIGIAIYPQDGEQIDTLIKNAEFALSRPHPKDTPRYQFYNPTMNSQASTIIRLENLLHQALAKEEFLLHYQPQVNINNGHIQGIEALIRWQNPELGMVSPASFIKLAERNGLIVPIGEWVLRTACAQSKLWQSQGLPTLRVSVNISSVQLQQPNLPFSIAEILEETQLEPNLLELEINATSLMQNVEYSRHILKQLHNLGVRICIDDFASGFSSLNYLKKLPFHTLKIDQSFIQDLSNDPQDLAIISALVSLGRGFNLRVVAEGVETEQQIELLRSLHCEQMQGYWFSRPLNAEDTTKLLPFDWEEA
jgi:diguanylate cyclase (GGDEF)-like protein/PAS domain S-box-containing protein